MKKALAAVILGAVAIISVIGAVSISSLENNDLEVGWNFIAIPVMNNFTAESLAQYIGDCDTVMKWDASAQSYISHAVGTPINNFDIENGIGYMVHVTSAKSINFAGSPIPEWTVTLKPGWNYLGNIYPNSMKAEVFGGLFDNCDTVMKWDTSTQSFISHPMGTPIHNFDIHVGEGVAVHVADEQVWHGYYIQPKEYTLTTSVYPEGAGRISPSGGTYVEGDTVTLHAYSTLNYKFDHWGGDASGTSSAVTITMDSNKTVIAYYEYTPPAIYTLTCTIYGGGYITADPPGTPSYGAWKYTEGTQVTLTATPADGWVFDRWSDNIGGSQNPTTITMDSNKTIAVHFSYKQQYTVIAVSNPTDGGTVTLTPSGGSYNAGDMVTITATPNNGYRFDHWSGDTSGTQNPVVLTIDGDKTIVAHFEKTKGNQMYLLPFLLAIVLLLALIAVAYIDDIQD